jgi:trehalose 6-phosphate synthase
MNNPRQLIVVANRLPVRRVSDNGDGWMTSPGGLVSALAPVMATRSNVAWVGWTGSTGPPPEPFSHENLALHPVELTEADMELYYEGFSNGTLWPLYHDAIAQPEFHRTWWDAYVTVNRRFADKVLDIAERDATVWVHDYQLQLVPGMLRQAAPDMRIGFFFHIPFPARELFLRLPWRTQVVRALLGADLIGFQTEVMAHNFRHVVPRLVDFDVSDPSDEAIVWAGRTTIAKPHPIGIDYERFAAASQTDETEADVEALRDTLNQPKKVLLGVDRLDYTKGIARRLRAYSELLAEGRIDAKETVFIQIAEPSRSNVLGYAEIRTEVEQLVGEINGNHATMARAAVHLFNRSHAFDELISLYRLADVMVVTPFRDGMNLVAKEYVATRQDDSGVLVLSEFAGAAHQLPQAVLVNPYDIEGLKDSIEFAVTMPMDEQARRMTQMLDTVSTNTAHTWAQTFLDDLEQR